MIKAKVQDTGHLDATHAPKQLIQLQKLFQKSLQSLNLENSQTLQKDQDETRTKKTKEGLKRLGVMDICKKMECKRRSLAKTLSWRATATMTTVGLVLFFTGKISLAIEIGALEVVAKMILFYLHERTWNNIKWGCKPNLT